MLYNDYLASSNTSVSSWFYFFCFIKSRKPPRDFLPSIALVINVYFVVSHYSNLSENSGLSRCFLSCSTILFRIPLLLESNRSKHRSICILTGWESKVSRRYLNAASATYAARLLHSVRSADTSSSLTALVAMLRRQRSASRRMNALSDTAFKMTTGIISLTWALYASFGCRNISASSVSAFLLRFDRNEFTNGRAKEII